MEGLVERIKEIQQESGLTNAEFAQKLGMSPASLSHMYNGRNNPSLTLIENILSAFDHISAEYLLTGAEVPSAHREEKSGSEEAKTTPLQAAHEEESPGYENATPASNTPPPISGIPSGVATSSKRVTSIIVLYDDGTCSFYTPQPPPER